MIKEVPGMYNLWGLEMFFGAAGFGTVLYISSALLPPSRSGLFISFDLPVLFVFACWPR